jgi:hypothetical protein
MTERARKSDGVMDDKNRKTMNRAGLAALVLLAPGGFILGFTLAARHYRKKREAEEKRKSAGSAPTDGNGNGEGT